MKIDVKRPVTLEQFAADQGIPLKALQEANPEISPSDPVTEIEIPARFVRQSLQDSAHQAEAVRGRPIRSTALGATPASPAAGGLIEGKVKKEWDAMTDRKTASRQLFAQHTVTKPSLSFEEASEILLQAEDAGLGKDVPSKEMGNVRVQDAAIAFLKYRFTPIDFDVVDPDKDYAGETTRALQVLRQADDAHKDAFAKEVLFNVAHPGNHQAMWADVISIVPPDEMEKMLLAGARSGNELHINNALHLPYVIYGREPQYQLSDSARAELSKTVDDLKKTNGLNLLLKQGLDDVRIPVNI